MIVMKFGGSSVANAERRVGVGAAVDGYAHIAVFYHCMVDIVVDAALAEPKISPLSGEIVVPAVMTQGGE